MNCLLDTQYIDQSVSAPTGCESVTAVMLSRYLGLDITVDRFIDTYLPKKDFTVCGNKVSGEIFDGFSLSGLDAAGNRIIGANPYECFAGNPRDPDSMGCYAPVIVSALDRLLSPLGYTVVNETGTDTDELIAKYIIGENTPVAVWATINLRQAIEGPAWFLENGEKFIWRSNEHCMLLIGCDDENYIFADPWNNNGIVRYPINCVNQRRREQYMQAVAVRKNNNIESAD